MTFSRQQYAGHQGDTLGFMIYAQDSGLFLTFGRLAMPHKGKAQNFDVWSIFRSVCTAVTDCLRPGDSQDQTFQAGETAQ